jgi:hypothetical protein
MRPIGEAQWLKFKTQVRTQPAVWHVATRILSISVT